MNLRRIFIREFELFFPKRRYLLLSCALSVLILCGTWVSCGNIGHIWRISRHPSVCPPLFLIFILWLFVCLSFGVLIILSARCGCHGSMCLRCIVSFFLSLSWCPLALVANSFLFSLMVLIFAGVHLFALARVICRYSLIATISVAIISSIEIYLIYFTVIFTLIN